MERMIHKRIKGAVTAESSLVVPVMILCILPFLYLFRMLLFQMVLEKGVDECIRQMAIEMYVLERVSILPEGAEKEGNDLEQSKVDQVEKLIEEYTSFFEEDVWKDKLEEWGYELAGESLFRMRLQDWMEAENLSAWGVKNAWDGISVSESDFFYTEEDHHYLLKGSVTFEWESWFAFWEPNSITIQRVYHCFMGENSRQDPMEEEEAATEDILVYRIGNGTKYHSSGCYLIHKHIYTTTRNAAKQGGKQSCERCKPEDVATVYLTKGGEHYHRSQCSYLNPNVSAMRLEEAVQYGYIGCGLCQGGDRYFSG